ncbi:unnamed protein product [Moneuplotes crassus]|uniref:TFIIS central domain-containing protein n=1 Tax=Euplotes crassus TaxID=5936 RepID=A0AAD1UBS8_EUPCR|nr:unnamed protein product [Moneuplotes crassus]
MSRSDSGRDVIDLTDTKPEHVASRVSNVKKKFVTLSELGNQSLSQYLKFIKEMKMPRSETKEFKIRKLFITPLMLGIEEIKENDPSTIILRRTPASKITSWKKAYEQCDILASAIVHQLTAYKKSNPAIKDNSQMSRLVHALNNTGNQKLRMKLLTCVISADKFVRMTPEDLEPEDKKRKKAEVEVNYLKQNVIDNSTPLLFLKSRKEDRAINLGEGVTHDVSEDLNVDTGAESSTVITRAEESKEHSKLRGSLKASKQIAMTRENSQSKIDPIFEDTSICCISTQSYEDKLLLNECFDRDISRFIDKKLSQILTKSDASNYQKLCARAQKNASKALGSIQKGFIQLKESKKKDEILRNRIRF